MTDREGDEPGATARSGASTAGHAVRAAADSSPAAADSPPAPAPTVEPIPTPPWAAPARRPRRADRPPLHRDQIVDAALRVVDAEGSASLSLRRLAGDLAVAPMSLYWHVRDKAQLLDLVGEAVLESIELPSRTGNWQDELRAVHRSMRVALDRHPNTADLMIGRARYGAAGLELFERILGILLDAGFTPEAAFAAYDSLYLFTLGYAATASRTTSFVAIQLEGLAYLQSLPAARFPAIHAVAPVIGGRSSDARFETGLDVVLEGIERRLGPRWGSRPGDFTSEGGVDDGARGGRGRRRPRRP